jgi:hypothetical protein
MNRWLFILMTMLLVACSTPVKPTKPVVTIMSPPNGSRVTVGESVTLFASGVSDVGIQRVELRLNGQVIANQVNASASLTFSPRFVYSASQVGTVLLSVVAFDQSGTPSDSADLQIIVDARPFRPNPEPTTTKAVPNTPAVFNPQCNLNAAFIADVTIPDNTVIRAGDPFIKTWRVRNTSGCDWTEGFELVFVQGSKMGAVPAVTILPTPRNGQLDLSMTFIAPKEADTYSSTWQLRAPNGKLFGTQMYVKIKVL